ncbi:Calpain-type cysteine protease dek1 [Entophlyctis luteolus]|nr:Calpain-type cysteine protease dek1 [Entophlyctis luteolus]
MSNVPGNIDPDVWENLPLDIQTELMLHHGIELPIAAHLLPEPISLKTTTITSGILVGESSSATADWRFSVSPSVEVEAALPLAPALPLASSDMQWVDPDFPPDASSIDGIRKPSTTCGDVPISKVAPPKCSCTPPKSARQKTVFKENKNQGRRFFACAASKCNYFSWASDSQLQHSKQNLSVKWVRFQWDPSILLEVSPAPSHIRQGRVGDCWFISALAVLAEQPDLVCRVLPPIQPLALSNGIYSVSLFIDGKWRSYQVDNHFATMPCPSKKSASISITSASEYPVLYFAKSVEGQMWAPIIEKAYAKAHSSYSSISGGWVCEALFDLTGFPTQSIHFGAEGFDSEAFWTRLLSFSAQGFLMGASCSFSGDGLVGAHAYSLLAVVEESIENGIVLGGNTQQQRDLRDFFASDPRRPRDRVCGTEDVGAAITENGMLRLIKLRNPWGRVEWKGTFGVGSDEMGPALKRRLNLASDNGKSYADDGGTFWISYHDFLRRFMSVDVCFTLRNYSVLNMELAFPEQSSLAHSFIEVSVPDPSWVHFSICQKTKRGKANEDFYYFDFAVLVLTLGSSCTTTGSNASVHDVRMFGQGRDAHFDMFLGERGQTARYLIVPLSLEREISLREARVCRTGMMRIGSGDSGIHRHRIPPMRHVEFTLRILSANPVGACKRPAADAPAADLWCAFVRAAAAEGSRGAIVGADVPRIVTRMPVSLPMLSTDRLGDDGEVNLLVVQGGGAALVVVDNTYAHVALRVRLRAAMAARTGCSTVATMWRSVAPCSRRVVAACVCPAVEAEGGHVLCMVDRVELEAVGIDAVHSGECYCDVRDNERGAGSDSKTSEIKRQKTAKQAEAPLECACVAQGLFTGIII